MTKKGRGFFKELRANCIKRLRASTLLLFLVFNFAVSFAFSALKRAKLILECVLTQAFTKHFLKLYIFATCIFTYMPPNFSGGSNRATKSR